VKEREEKRREKKRREEKITFPRSYKDRLCSLGKVIVINSLYFVLS
jgi:hypothetical protein